MKRNLQTLSMALVAALALSAVVASAASAAPKLTPVPEEYPVTLKGEQTVAHIFELAGGRKIECAKETLEGTVSNKAQAEESKGTVSPVYNECTATILGNKYPETITLNACKYLITSTETTTGTIAAEGWEVTSSVQVKCPEGKQIELHTFTSETKHLENVPLCTYTIAEQSVGGSLVSRLTEKNGEGAGTSTDIKSTLTGVAISRVAGTAVTCGPASQTGAATGEVKGEGFNLSGEMLRSKVED